MIWPVLYESADPNHKTRFPWSVVYAIINVLDHRQTGIVTPKTDAGTLPGRIPFNAKGFLYYIPSYSKKKHSMKVDIGQGKRVNE
ncbi:hypothetical protein L195_g011413 [Trifolium pratense]|uniref:Uncharacterized protein n=1 Tax=Trifolium pratense TaxID=57577 RepID=A0A2K3PHF4_TRIPR|nr:hypothetical protein L195_g016116 [Trifolium pratense]PNY14729.1 hypothetical protein L195_g011413 [Trifolium pratense]